MIAIAQHIVLPYIFSMSRTEDGKLLPPCYIFSELDCPETCRLHTGASKPNAEGIAGIMGITVGQYKNLLRKANPKDKKDYEETNRNILKIVGKDGYCHHNEESSG